MKDRDAVGTAHFGIMAGALLAAALLVGGGCNSAPPSSTGDNTLLNEALGYDGKVTGQVSTVQSTRASIDGAAATQQAPLDDALAGARVRFQDIAGNPLMDENGNPLPPVPLKPDGSFTGENLPVGTDFTVCVDVAGDGSCKEASCVNIPLDPNGNGGELANVQVDPLTTLVLGKLRTLLTERGIDARKLPISPATVVARIVEAYTHLFEESGIAHEVTVDDLASLSPEEFGQLFDEIIPDLVQTGMRIVEGNLDLISATDAQQRAVAAAEVFLRAGFPIADEPGGLDLARFATLDGVESARRDELFGDKPQLGDFADNVDDGFADTLGTPQPAEDDPTIIYFDTTTEPDRNFSNTDEGADDASGMPHLPVIADRVLLKMAEQELAGKKITIRALYAALTDIGDGLGARLTYEIHDPNFGGPPLTVFQTADGAGKALNLEQLYRRFFEQGLNLVTEEDLNQANARLAQTLNELLGDTLAPDFEVLFGEIVAGRIGSADELAKRIRDARAHLPFNRSGPESFFVVADGDTFRGDADVNPVTVDADVDQNGRITAVTYNADGEGDFYLGFTPGTDQGGDVQLITRETGRIVQGPRGPVRLNLRSEDVFAPVNGAPFFAFVSESGTFYPGVDIPAPRTQFMPAPMPNDGGGNMPPPNDDPNGMPPNGDPTGMPPSGTNGFPPGDPNAPPPDPNFPTDDAGQPGPGPNMPPDGSVDDPNNPPLPPAPAEFDDQPEQRRMLVLATGWGPDAELVRVDFDRGSGIATYNRDGRNLLVFTPESEATGQFVLFNEDTGREARAEDPENFFAPPPPPPDDFEDQFNNGDDSRGPDGSPDGGPGDFDPDNIDTNAPLPPPPPPVDEPTPDDVDTSGIGPAEYVDDGGRILIAVDEIEGLRLEIGEFTHVFGSEAPNARYSADADPYFDDINSDGVQSADEPSVAFRPTLFDPHDWRSTDIPAYYRRADDGGAVTFDDVDIDASSPRALDGTALVPRNYVPRLNAYRFGRPNTAVNLLTAFSPPSFFDGTQQFTEDTEVDIFTAVALVNLVMDQVFNVEATVDIDGMGPLPKRQALLDAHLFIVPLDDPFVTLVRTIADRAQADVP
ncbi:MAG: hypothetical protein H6816_12855 [Phycisphaerales bacterium]|nr:hypothetical protein [Phycisphaerales bacterium]